MGEFPVQEAGRVSKIRGNDRRSFRAFPAQGPQEWLHGITSEPVGVTVSDGAVLACNHDLVAAFSLRAIERLVGRDQQFCAGRAGKRSGRRKPR